MRMLVLGAGLQGSACAYDLLQNHEVERVTLGDVAVDVLPPFLDRYHDDPRLRLERVDARDRDAVRALMVGHTACMNALPYYFNLAMTEDAIAGGLHYADLGGNTEIVFEQLELDALAREKGVSFDAILLAWLLRHPAGIQPIIGTTRPERIRDACAADSVQLTREEWYALLAAGNGRSVA